jgi:hypothetical protein
MYKKIMRFFLKFSFILVDEVNLDTKLWVILNYNL